MNRLMARKIRFLASFLVAMGLVLAYVLPGLAYNEANVKHIRMVRLSPIVCGEDTAIRLAADLTDKNGNPVVGATVNFTLKKGQAGDSIAPASDVSDSEGRARTNLRLSDLTGNRIVVASVPGDGKGQITINAKKGDPGCTKKGAGEGAVEGVTGAPVTLPPTTTSIDQAPAAAAQVLPVLGILVTVAAASALVTLALRRSSRRVPRA